MVVEVDRGREVGSGLGVERDWVLVRMDFEARSLFETERQRELEKVQVVSHSLLRCGRRRRYLCLASASQHQRRHRHRRQPALALDLVLE